MPDVINEGKDILIDPSLNENPELSKDNGQSFSNEEKEGLLKEIQKERQKRQQLENEKAELESKVNNNYNPTPDQDDIDLDLVVDRLAPTLLKRGFITKQQSEDEAKANQYAQELKDLSTKYDGSDGRPVFDANEVANYAKETKVFNLEAAYRNLHWKELVDFEKKNTDVDNVETEKPNSTNANKPGERVLLTREFLVKRMAEPDGKAWYNKNHDKIIAAMAKGQL